MKPILIATKNPGKLKEIQSLLQSGGDPPAPQNWQLVLPSDLGLDIEVDEDGTTYVENAAKKALAYSQFSNMICLADDSGLEVDTLQGEPGLRSARYSPLAGATDADRRTFLLHNLHKHPRPWPARFLCTVAIATPDGHLYYAEGGCEGEIIPEERGSQGFGYDPVFYLPGLKRTMAELTLEEKNRISHRAAAIRGASSILARLTQE